MPPSLEDVREELSAAQYEALKSLDDRLRAVEAKASAAPGIAVAPPAAAAGTAAAAKPAATTTATPPVEDAARPAKSATPTKTDKTDKKKAKGCAIA